MVDGSARLQIAGIFGAATLLVVVGSLDDRGLLHHQVKLLVAMPISAAILIAVGVRAVVFTQLFGGGAVAVTADLALTFLWVVGITAAFSILDHMDGLCAGVAATASAFFLIVALGSSQLLVATLAAAVLGAAVGFLRWNFSPAKIFMGDGGAMFLGFMMATLGLKLRVDSAWPAALLVPALVLLVPIFDTTLVTISRLRRGLVPFSSPGKDHTSHRLVTLGLDHRSAVLMMYGVGTVGGVAALVVRRTPVSLTYGIAGLGMIGALMIIAWLERTAFERQQRTQAPSVSAR
jgi:UDP-GlcNAc:undecaprenyl-phosphate GlcNAc-1-phosphate transferase